MELLQHIIFYLSDIFNFCITSEQQLMKKAHEDYDDDDDNNNIIPSLPQNISWDGFFSLPTAILLQ
jgi:hypothetical protein